MVYKNKCPVCIGKNKRNFSNKNSLDHYREYQQSNCNNFLKSNINGIKRFKNMCIYSDVYILFKIRQNIYTVILIFTFFVGLTFLIFTFAEFDLIQNNNPRISWVPEPVVQWLNFAPKNSEIQTHCKSVGPMTSILEEHLSTFEKKFEDIERKLIDKDSVHMIINEYFMKYDADKLGITDFALNTAGARVISTPDTKQWPPESLFRSLIFWLEVPKVQGPQAVIEAGTNVGECWAFQGDHGNIIIQLAGQVWIGAVTMEHISSLVSLDGSISTAPKEFSVKGLNNLSSCGGVLLGNFEFLDNGSARQTFDLSEESINSGPFEFIELSIKSNHGHPDYTCIYRFRVHGKLEKRDKD